MDESLRLSTVQRQQQTLAPMQLQFVRVLEMTENEAEDEVRRALDENPALEIQSQQDSPEPADDFGESAEQLQMADYSSEDDIPFYHPDSASQRGAEPAFESVTVDSGPTMIEYLMGQLSQMPSMSDTDLEIARYIVGSIDDNGYMTRTLRSLIDDMAIQIGLEVPEEQVRRVWDAVRSLDPPGIGAVDLRECLLLQLRHRPQTDESIRIATEIVRDYFDLFSLMHFDRLRQILGVNRQQMGEAIDIIKSLNPKPGSIIASQGADDRLRHITPDFLVETDGADTLTLTSLSRIPALQIEESFRVDMEPSAGTSRKEVSDANAFIRRRRDEAANFIKVIEMRGRTLYRVMQAIMLRQRDFFLSGDDPECLKPMILKDISADTGDDISVISRATRGKYVATHSGIYPLKYFFTERHNGNDDVSSRNVMEALRRFIDEEDPAAPLTDEALTRLLVARGYDVARRTVAKYREKLGIPVGRLRHRM